jgi:hypothetical protein
MPPDSPASLGNALTISRSLELPFIKVVVSQLFIALLLFQYVVNDQQHTVSNHYHGLLLSAS